jgi:hypothetical protein
MLDTALELVVANVVVIVAYCCARAFIDPEDGRRRECWRARVLHDVSNWRVRLEAQLTYCRRQGWTVFLLLMWVTLVLQVASSFLDR